MTCGVVGCEVPGWFGRRFVSLPFSDHCDPLVDERSDMVEIAAFLRGQVQDRKWRRVELRPRRFRKAVVGRTGVLVPGQRYCLHSLDLSPAIDDLHAALHRSCMQRAIRRAEREALTCDSGASESLLSAFYTLLRLTRQRHGLPPQPVEWFRNLARCLGERMTIRVARKGDTPVAAVMTLSFNKAMVYKYGCSDTRFHKLGAMPFLLWQTIRDAKDRGLCELDLGRSDLDQPTLIRFKERLGAGRSELIYYGYPAPRVSPGHQRWTEWVSRAVFARMPEPALTLAGRLLYKHLA